MQGEGFFGLPGLPQAVPEVHYPPIHGKIQGTTCYFCGHVGRSKKHKFDTLAEYIDALGESSEMYEEHLRLVGVLIDACQKASSYTARVSWSTVEAEASRP